MTSPTSTAAPPCSSSTRPADGTEREKAEAELLAALVARAPVREFGRVVRPLSEIFREVIR